MPVALVWLDVNLSSSHAEVSHRSVRAIAIRAFYVFNAVLVALQAVYFLGAASFVWTHVLGR